MFVLADILSVTSRESTGINNKKEQFNNLWNTVRGALLEEANQPNVLGAKEIWEKAPWWPLVLYILQRQL